MTQFKLTTALVAAGLMAAAAPALAQQSVSPKSGPDANQPKVVPQSDSRMPATTSGAGAQRDNSNIKGGGGDAGSSGSSGSAGASGAGSGGGSGGSGSGSSGGGSQ